MIPFGVYKPIVFVLVVNIKMDKAKEKIYIAGHRGMVGSAALRALEQQGQTNFVTRTHDELGLTIQTEEQAFFQKEKPTQVYLAATLGGIHANNIYPAAFIYQNLIMQANVIDAAFHNDV